MSTFSIPPQFKATPSSDSHSLKTICTPKQATEPALPQIHIVTIESGVFRRVGCLAVRHGFFIQMEILLAVWAWHLREVLAEKARLQEIMVNRQPTASF